MDVLRPECIETTALGAAYLAGIAVGFWSDLDDVRENWTLSHTFQANMRADRRNTLLKGWRKAVKCSFGWAEEEE